MKSANHLKRIQMLSYGSFISPSFNFISAILKVSLRSPGAMARTRERMVYICTNVALRETTPVQ
jgi:hypothetical protein